MLPYRLSMAIYPAEEGCVESSILTASLIVLLALASSIWRSHQKTLIWDQTMLINRQPIKQFHCAENPAKLTLSLLLRVRIIKCAQ